MNRFKRNSLVHHETFWAEQPALLFGLSLLIGTSSFFYWQAPWNWIWPLLWGIYLICLRLWAPILLIFTGIGYSWCMAADIPSIEKGYFTISLLKPHVSPFEKGLMYKGMLYIDGQRIPCSVHHSDSKDRPKANCDYILFGKAIQKSQYECHFKAKKWVPVENTWSLAEYRFQIKEDFRKFLDQKLKRPRVASLLGSLITGDIEDRSLRYEFGKVGLQHLLAISGFHFAILMAFCSFFLGLFLPHKPKNIVLLLAISAYFFFVGPVPAVQRSWLTAVFYLIGKWMGRHASGLNLLGTALLIEIILDPLVSAQLGFQLSFLSCAGILLFLPVFKPWVENLLPKVVPQKLNRWAQHGYLATSFFREGIVIALSVNTAILPLILYHFHSFPLLSLLYNLFFPLLLSLTLFILLIAFLAEAIFPPLATVFFTITDFFTAELLDIASYPPVSLDYFIRVIYFPPWIIPIYLFSLFSISIRKRRFFLTNTSYFSKI